MGLISRVSSRTYREKKNKNMADRYNIFSQMEHVQSKYTGCGHPDISRWEWMTNQHRDTYSSIINHPDLINMVAVCENETKARVKFNLMQKMFQPCGPPPKKPAWLDI